MEQTMFHAMRTVTSACAVTGILLAANAWASETIRLETCATMQWTGRLLPELGQYVPPAGEARPAILMRAGSRSSPEWSKPVDCDLSGMDSVAVRLVSSAAVDITIGVRSGDGRFVRAVSLTLGEQVVLVPLGAFARDQSPAGWGNVSALSISLAAAGTDAKVDLLDISALPAGARLPGDELFLVRPVSPLNPIGRAWPMYAILHEIAHPERSERSPHTLQRYLKQIYEVEIPINPARMKADGPIANVILMGREVALKAGTVTEDELTRQGYSGFVIKADDGLVTVAGVNRHGTTYGTYRFLEKQGCRFFLPGGRQYPPETESHDAHLRGG